MKKLLLYISGMIAALILMFVLYNVSYNISISHQQQDTDETKATEETVPTKSVVEANASRNGKVQPTTECVLEVYDMKKDMTETMKMDVPVELIGCDRSEVIRYLNLYMADIPLEDYSRGLLSYELVSFSNEQIVLRKSYNTDNIPYKYYMALVQDEVVVYYCDKKTVYQYTGIYAEQLPDDAVMELNNGIFVEDEEELYGILENYSS